MLLLKLVLAVLATACILVVFTIVWVVSLNRGADGIDIDLVSAITLHSPLFWLLAITLLVAAGWLSRRWVFPA
jgi:hypothetical protein